MRLVLELKFCIEVQEEGIGVGGSSSRPYQKFGSTLTSKQTLGSKFKIREDYYRNFGASKL